MEILIFIIIIIFVIIKNFAKSVEKTGGSQTDESQTMSNQTMNQSRPQAVPNQSRPQAVQTQPRPQVMPAQPRPEKTAAGLKEDHTSILERAKDNARERIEDVTLNTMEAEHNHSERVSPAVHNHSEDVLEENLLGSISDLMVKGYDGNLCFERDFLGEAMDMIGRFTVPSEVLDYNKKVETK